MFISKEIVYAVRVMAVLAGTDAPVAEDDFTRRFGVPRNFLSLILQRLEKAGLVRRAGKKAYDIMRAPGEISLLDIAGAAGGPFELVAPERAGRGEIPALDALERAWEGLKDEIERYLARVTLKRLADKE